jgi:hypothetical protein
MAQILGAGALALKKRGAFLNWNLKSLSKHSNFAARIAIHRNRRTILQVELASEPIKMFLLKD